MDAGAEHLRVPLGEGPGGADLAALGRVVHEELGLVDLLLEAPVHPVEVFLFDADLSVPHRIRRGVPIRSDRGLLLCLNGHRAPF
ncbi:hypothetical protein Saso_29970 [Streptomyces asoensis]|uniref:Uncharacterized protein n=1 Tax=Streptomyces asoensis TaxID=249586 RepID=A0ABQ3RZP9_9ACTN|nr:hypothetical protein GCM10010496_11560 [Streptomyces asoensis]GHI61347.1 hypothetical protein Saso_29970 [Streptomyces asoensis]